MSLNQATPRTRFVGSGIDDDVDPRDERIEQLKQQIKVLSDEKRHTALMHRDYIFGLRAQMTVDRKALLEISAGFSTALSVIEDREYKLDERDRTIEEREQSIEDLHRTVSQLQKKVQQQTATAKQRARTIRELKASTTWRIGRFFTKPLSIFKR